MFKEGQKVGFITDSYNAMPVVAKVTRVTKTQVVINRAPNSKFRQTGGYLVGGNAFSRARIFPITEEQEYNINHNKAVSCMVGPLTSTTFVDNIRWYMENSRDYHKIIDPEKLEKLERLYSLAKELGFFNEQFEKEQTND